MDQTIRPKIGLGPIMLGTDEQTIKSLLGMPSAVKKEEWPNNDFSCDWAYEQLMLSLSFNASDDFRLGMISTENNQSVLDGMRIVGIAEAELLQSNFCGAGPPILDDDFDELGKDFFWDELSLSCWVVDGVVQSVTIIPRYDPTGENPIWPHGA